MAKNSIFSGRLSRGKLRATVINAVWPELLFFTLVSTGEWVLDHPCPHGEVLNRTIARSPVVVLVDRFTHIKLAFNNQLLTVLGVVLGLVISFRTSTAYER